jgi:DNA-binding MarR family transcriptional regulator
MRPKKDFEPPPADPLPFDRSTGFLIRDTHLSVARALRQHLSEAGVTPGQWYVLKVLWHQDGTSQRELSDRVGITQPVILNALRRLERAGWIRRQRSATDRRSRIVFLTEAGRRLEQDLIHHAIEVNEIATGGMSEAEVTLLWDLLKRVKRNLVEDAEKWDRARPARAAARAREDGHQGQSQRTK